MDDPPERSDDPGIVKVGSIRPAFSLSSFPNVQTEQSRTDRAMYHRFKYTMEVNFRSKDGILSFDATVGDKVIAHAYLDLDS